MHRIFSAGAILLGSLLAAPAFAQSQVTPKLGYVYPMGAKAGDTITLTATGSDLGEPETLYFSFPGAKTEPVQTGPIKVDPKKAMPNTGMKAPTGMASFQFTVTVPPGTPPGAYDVRYVSTKGGVSNPRVFVVGDQSEINEIEPNDDTPKAQKVPLNTVIDGVVSTGTDVDYFQIAGKKGQRVLFSAQTSSIDSRLPVMIEIYNANGDLLGSNKAYTNNDAFVDVTLPADADYFVRLFSFTYTAGGTEYFYRLSISTAPWIDAVAPHTLEPGKETAVTVYGRNLPGGVLDKTAIDDRSVLEKVVVKIQAPKDPLASQRLAINEYVPPGSGILDGFEFRMKNPSGTSNGFLISLAQAPVVIGNDKNTSQKTAQKVQLPCEISGRFNQKNIAHWYSFAAKKGEVWSFEALGDRLGSPLDLIYRIVDAKGTFITEQDEVAEITANYFYTKSDDPGRYRWTAPADGDYGVTISSRYSFLAAGPRHMYTLRITKEDPDFRLVAMPVTMPGQGQYPDAVTLGQGGSQAYSVLAFRSGGFAGDIVVTGADLPKGITVAPQMIAGNQKQATVIVQAAADAPPYLGKLKLVGSATTPDKKFVREVRSASITWPITVANTPSITRMDRELVIAVRDKAQFAIVVEAPKISVALGDKISVPVVVKYLDKEFKKPINVTALTPPTGMVVQAPLTLTPENPKGVLQIDSKGGLTVLPGNYNLALRGQTEPYVVKQQNNKTPPVNFVQVAPPVPLTLVPKTLAKINNPPPLKVAPGKPAELAIKVGRLGEYSGPFQVELVDGKGITAPVATIKAGEDETKLILDTTKAQPNAPGALLIRITGQFNDIAIPHELKVPVSVTK